ncbi:hypothetical protein [Parasphingorhabdus sp.]|uniref:hypothetical protein n=1 Tax=Parasphingorhabdus sp. TaxID=2709688 RepID=UPI002F91D7FE
MAEIATTAEVIEVATEHLNDLSGHIFDLLTVSKPITSDAAVNLSKVVSKLSPILGNLIEFNAVEFLNDKEEFHGVGEWERQDPGFPDTVFRGIEPTPGFEIKAWFPLATEITARFKDSQNHFADDNTYVCLLAWLPEFLIYGKPYILDVVVMSGASVAKSRDDHYHNPPDYIVLEPEDTTARTANLQQTNTSGHKLQETDPARIAAAEALVRSWGPQGRAYQPTPDYQLKLRVLQGQFNYRLDTNYAKMDRIVHQGLEAFKTKVMATQVHGLKVRQWERLFRSPDTDLIKQTLRDHLNITEGDPDDIIE